MRVDSNAGFPDHGVLLADAMDPTGPAARPLEDPIHERLANLSPSYVAESKKSAGDDSVNQKERNKRRTAGSDASPFDDRWRVPHPPCPLCSKQFEPGEPRMNEPLETDPSIDTARSEASHARILTTLEGDGPQTIGALGVDCRAE